MTARSPHTKNPIVIICWFRGASGVRRSQNKFRTYPFCLLKLFSWFTRKGRFTNVYDHSRTAPRDSEMMSQHNP